MVNGRSGVYETKNVVNKSGFVLVVDRSSRVGFTKNVAN